MQSISRFLYGPPTTERVSKWCSELRSESRKLDREIRSLDQAQSKTKSEITKLAKKGDKEGLKNARILAKEVVRSNRRKEELYKSQARLNSINMQLSQQLATLKITGTLQKSTEIMKLSNDLIRLPELQKTMQSMSAEMMKAGIISEMVDDSLETADPESEEDLEEEADKEVESVLFQITNGKLGRVGNVGSELPETLAEEEEEEDMQRMQAQLDGLLKA